MSHRPQLVHVFYITYDRLQNTQTNSIQGVLSYSFSTESCQSISYKWLLEILANLTVYSPEEQPPAIAFGWFKHGAGQMIS